MPFKTKEQKAEYDKKRYQERREQKLAYMKLYRKNKPDIRRTWTNKNRDKINAQKRKWRWENRARVLELRKEYEKTPRAKHMQATRREKWIKTNPDKYLAHKIAQSVRSRYKEYGIDKKVVPFDVTHLYEVTQCNWCSLEFLDTDKLAFDHIVPISRGGEHVKENLQILHFSCNSQKGIR